ncbi:MAG TPA: hypothetical protein VK158_02140 [Acidobacteriota bacterium]|nr:hypothetical protein [Acidobacteriota bacterium]
MKTMPLAKTAEQQEFWEKFKPVNRTVMTDTYKRTMAGTSAVFADLQANYYLAARKPLNEPAANGRLIVAGLEKVLYPTFGTAITQAEVDRGAQYAANAVVKKFPQKAWDLTLANGGYMPLDIYALPGGQTILAKDGKHVPIMSVEGVGALVSHIEPTLTTLYKPMIHATKARLMRDVVDPQHFAEFGLRCEDGNVHVPLLLALHVGGGFTKTSNDYARYLFPELFTDIGTVGHEFAMAYQTRDRTLLESQEVAYREFIKGNDVAALLPDVVDTLNVGLPLIQKLKQEFAGTAKIIFPRFDSGNVPTQCAIWKHMLETAGHKVDGMVVEDGYTPTKARETFNLYKQAGGNPLDIVVGAGGYFADGCTRDAISMAYKRSATLHPTGWETGIKFSDTPGKESIPGRVRVYEQGRKLIVAQADEKIDGTPLMIPVVLNGRYVYNEDLATQQARAQATWNKYDTVEYSPLTQQIMDQRLAEKEEVLAHFSAK